MPKKFLVLFALASLPVLALVASACGDDDDDSASAATASATGEIAAVAYLDKAGLHDIDVAINETKQVPTTARTTMLKSAAVIRNTEWPADHKAAADSLSKSMADLADLLKADPVDMTKAGELAAKVYEDAHDFTADVWNELYKAADLPVAASHD